MYIRYSHFGSTTVNTTFVIEVRQTDERLCIVLPHVRYTLHSIIGEPLPYIDISAKNIDVANEMVKVLNTGILDLSEFSDRCDSIELHSYGKITPISKKVNKYDRLF